MKEQDLRACFDRIQPGEELIAETMQKIEEVQKKPKRRHRPADWFAQNHREVYRFAAAACAVVLVLGVWAFRQPSPPEARPFAIQEDYGARMISEIPDGVSFEGKFDAEAAAQMAARARQMQEEYMLLEVQVDAFEEKDGRSAVRITPLYVIDSGMQSDLASPAQEGEVQMLAAVEWESEQEKEQFRQRAQDRAALMVLIPQEDGMWQIAEYQLENIEQEP